MLNTNRAKFRERSDPGKSYNEHSGSIEFRKDSPHIYARFSSRIKERIKDETLYPMDIFSLGYLGITLLLMLTFHKNIENGFTCITQYSFFGAGVLGLIFFRRKFPEQPVLKVAGTIYPMAVIAFGWGTVTPLACMIYGNYWTTDRVVYFDRLLFGTHPTVWFRQFHYPWLYELMNLFYSSYYVWMPAILLILIIKGSYRQLRYAISLVSFTFLSNIVLFYLFPTLGPQMTPEIMELSGASSGGYWIASFTRWMQSNGSAIGGAFPSSHVSVTTIWALAMLKISRPVGIFLLFLMPGIALSTVYLGYHHALDPITGILWGYVSYRLVEGKCRYLIGKRDSDYFLIDP